MTLELDASHSWIGRIPKDWRVVPLRQLVQTRAGGTPSSTSDEYWDDAIGMPWLSIGDLDAVDRGDDHHGRFLVANGVKASRLVPSSAVTVLFAMYASVGEVAFLTRPAVWNQAILGLEPRVHRVHPRFLYWALKALKPTLPFHFRSNTQDNLNAEQVRAFKLPQPPLSTQRAIADYLDRETARIDAFIAKNEELITLLTERRSVIIDDAVWSGITRGAPRSKHDDALPPAPDHWMRARNKQLYIERIGVSTDGAEELLTVSHITGVTPRSTKNVTMFEAETTVGYKFVHQGDLVINTMWAWMGALGVSQYEGIASPSYGVYCPARTFPYEPRYFDRLYRSAPYVAEMTGFSRGITESRLRLYPDAFLRLPVVIPPFEEQRAIADYVDHHTARIDAAIASAQKCVALVTERRAALISAAVTGKIDLGVAV